MRLIFGWQQRQSEQKRMLSYSGLISLERRDRVVTSRESITILHIVLYSFPPFPKIASIVIECQNRV
jgi:hypothetical protein